MIATVTLNPCIDKTIYLDNLTVGEYNRVKNIRTDICGKGINVSTALSHFQLETKCLGFNFRENGHMLEKILAQQEIPYDFVLTDGEIRTNIKLFDNSCRVMTEINEAGQAVPEQAIEQLFEKIQNILEQTDILVMSGSIPPGVPADIYKRIIQLARQKDVKTILDAAGESFLLGLEAKPFLIKPNTFELEQAFAEEIQSGLSSIEIAQKIIADGIPYVCISMGAEGALLIDNEHVYKAKPLPVKVQGLTGAGDSMVAGMCYAIQQGLGTKEMLRYAMASAAGSIRQPGTLLATKKDLEELLPQVEITEPVFISPEW